MITAALQIEKVTAVATSPAHGQIVDLEGFVYLAQDLAGANQDALRYDLADRLASADRAYLDGEQRLSQGDRRGANDKFTQAQLGLGKFIELVQKSTQDAQHPANPDQRGDGDELGRGRAADRGDDRGTDPVAAGREPRALAVRSSRCGVAA